MQSLEDGLACYINVDGIESKLGVSGINDWFMATANFFLQLCCPVVERMILFWFLFLAVDHASLLEMATKYEEELRAKEQQEDEDLVK